MSTSSASWLQDLKTGLDELTAQAGGPAVGPADVFHPHVSLGYSSGEIEEQAVHEALDGAGPHAVTVV
jgi:2'-5' RNA ligase